MKTKIMHIMATGCLCLILASSVMGQDLIEATQSGLTTVKKHTVNQIAEHVAAHKTTGNFAPASLFTIASSQLKTHYEDDVEDAVYLHLDREAVSQLNHKRRDYLTLNIPVSDTKAFQVELIKVDILSDNFQVKTNDGKVIYTDDVPGVFYRGIIKGDLNSTVSFSIFNNHIQGLISDDNGNYTLGKVKNLSDTYILHNDRKSKVEYGFSCGTEDMKQVTVPEGIRQKSASTGDCVGIYIETRHRVFEEFNNNFDEVINFVTNLINQVSVIYSNEGVSIQLSELVIWTREDKYTRDLEENPNATRLGNFASEMGWGFNGDFAYLIDIAFNLLGQPIDGVRGTSVLDYGEISVVGPSVFSSTSNSKNVYVFAHELGHNFGSPHTHQCAWNGNKTAIDGCASCHRFLTNSSGCNDCPHPDPATPPGGGTIMSYCTPSHQAGNSLVLHPQVGKLIRETYENREWSSCSTDSETWLCPERLNIYTDYTDSENLNFEVRDSILAFNVIGNGAAVTYDVGKAVILKGESGGFHAEYGSDFHALIDGCGSALIVNRNSDDSTSDSSEQTPDTATVAADELALRNFPNPFTGTTTIEFSLKTETSVTLFVSDLTGKKIAVLLNSEQKTEGTHEAIFDGNNYPSGMYYYTIQAGEYVSTQKMILTK